MAEKTQRFIVVATHEAGPKAFLSHLRPLSAAQATATGLTFVVHAADIVTEEAPELHSEVDVTATFTLIPPPPPEEEAPKSKKRR